MPDWLDWLFRLRPHWEALATIAAAVSAIAAWRAVVSADRLMERDRRWKQVDRLSSAYQRIVSRPADKALAEFQKAAAELLTRGWRDLRTLATDGASYEEVLRKERQISTDFKRVWNRFALRLTQAAEAWRDEDRHLRDRLRREGAEKLETEVIEAIGGMKESLEDPGFQTLIAVHAGRIQRIILANDPAMSEAELPDVVIVVETSGTDDHGG